MNRRFLIAIFCILAGVLAWELAHHAKLLTGRPPRFETRTLSSEEISAHASPQLDKILDKPDATYPPNAKQNIAKIITAFSAPISFFGKVQDQNGIPVSGAKVYYSAADHYFGSSSKYEGVSDNSGNFSLTGVKGAGIYVEVSKFGYDRIPNRSYGSFGYSVPSGNSAPSQQHPAVFVLRRKADADSLIVVDRDIVVPKDGQKVGISLEKGKAVPPDRADLTIQCWANDQQQDAQRRYNWQFELVAPGGGLLRRLPEDLKFEAPEEGYQESIHQSMATNATRWRVDFEDEYFVKLGSGKFGRMRFRITTNGDHFATITSYLNPTPGSRNLEFDPAKQIKAK